MFECSTAPERISRHTPTTTDKVEDGYLIKDRRLILELEEPDGATLCEISYERDQDDGSLEFLECYAMGRAGPKR